jgi:hypothetical protein
VLEGRLVVGISFAGIKTIVAEGALAFQMRRAAAARANECGLQILNMPQVAARLAGGFVSPVTAEHLEPAIQQSLNVGGFTELAGVRHLPGMTRAVARTLRKAWDADIDLFAMGKAKGGRVGELALIENRLREALPRAMLTPRDLRDAALERMQHAPKVIGPVCIERLSFVPPVWRPLINGLCKIVAVEWQAPKEAETDWFAGSVTTVAPPRPSTEPTVASCADPHHEVVESLRWARQLITSGTAKPHEIAITSASTMAWDDHFLALAANAGLRLHFSHGIPALTTRDGQCCAALADILLHGLSQQRVRRLLFLCLGQGLALDELPVQWLAALPRGASKLQL